MEDSSWVTSILKQEDLKYFGSSSEIKLLIELGEGF